MLHSDKSLKFRNQQQREHGDYMTSHGFARPTVKSGKTSAKEITEIAKQISLVKPIIRSHVVQHIACGEAIGYDIIFEFGYLRKHDMTPTDLLKKLQKTIRVGEHQIANSTDFWVIQESYQDGRLIDSHLQEE